jgi:predicted KAP-like P-loop ATPase
MASQQNPLVPRYEFYRDSLIELIKNSHPNFSIGICGEWGMGKSTFLKCLYEDLNKFGEVATVWFNSWQYEAETNYALLPLLKEMGTALSSNYGNQKKKELKTVIKGILKAIAKVSPYILSAFLPVKWDDDDTERFKKAIDAAADQGTATLNELDQKIADQFSYSDGIKQIEKAMKNSRNDPNTSKFRIVIFIDDLDRCSPKKTLEVFESIKVLLDIE